MTTKVLYAPGAKRSGPWTAYGRYEVRIEIERGFDCRRGCEHLPPMPNEGGKNHDQSGDEWRLACRANEVAVELTLYTWIRNGARIAGSFSSTRPLLYGAHLFFHHGRRAPRLDCHLLPRGCVLESTSAFAADALWGEAESAMLEPYAFADVSEVDMEGACAVLDPVWRKLTLSLDDVLSRRDRGG